MTLQEFRAWLDGFCAANAGAPDEEQWALIRAKLGEVREAPVVPMPGVGPSTWPVRPTPSVPQPALPRIGDPPLTPWRPPMYPITCSVVGAVGGQSFN